MLPPTSALPLTAEQVVETGLHDFVGLLFLTADIAVSGVGLAAYTEALTQCRPSPGNGAGARQDCVLKRREITDADKSHALLNRFGNLLVVDAAENSAQPVTAARDHCDICTTGGSAVNRRQTRFVIAGEAQIAGQRSLVNFDLMPECLQAGHAAFERSLVAHGARRRINVNVFFHGEPFSMSRALAIRAKARGPA